MIYGVFAYSREFGFEFIATTEDRHKAYKYAKELNDKKQRYPS